MIAIIMSYAFAAFITPVIMECRLRDVPGYPSLRTAFITVWMAVYYGGWFIGFLLNDPVPDSVLHLTGGFLTVFGLIRLIGFMKKNNLRLTAVCHGYGIGATTYCVVALMQ